MGEHSERIFWNLVVQKIRTENSEIKRKTPHTFFCFQNFLGNHVGWWMPKWAVGYGHPADITSVKWIKWVSTRPSRQVHSQNYPKMSKLAICTREARFLTNFTYTKSINYPVSDTHNLAIESRMAKLIYRHVHLCSTSILQVLVPFGVQDPSFRSSWFWCWQRASREPKLDAPDSGREPSRMGVR